MFLTLGIFTTKVAKKNNNYNNNTNNNNNNNNAQPTLLATTSRNKLGFVDDTNLDGIISHVANDVQHIIDSHQNIGLHLNSHKCEIIANNFELVDQYPIFKDFKRIANEDMSLLGVPILEGKAVDTALQAKIKDLEHGRSNVFRYCMYTTPYVC